VASIFQQTYTPSDMIVYTGKEGGGWGQPPASTDNIPAALTGPPAVPKGGRIYKEFVESCTTTTMRQTEELSEYAGVAADLQDEIRITGHSETTLDMAFRPFGAPADNLGNIMGAGSQTSGVPAPSGAAQASAADVTNTYTGPAGGLWAHVMQTATAFNRCGTSSVWHDTGDHNNVMLLRANTLSSYKLSWGNTQTVKANMVMQGLCEMIPSDGPSGGQGTYIPGTEDGGGYVPLTAPGPPVSAITKVDVDTGFLCDPFESSLVKFNLVGSSGTVYPSLWCEGGTITIDRTIEPMFANNSNSATVQTTVPSITGTTVLSTADGASGPALTPTDHYAYQFTAVDVSGNETAMSTALSFVAGASGTTWATITAGTGLFPASAVAVNVYRTQGGASAPGTAFYYIGTMWPSSWVASPSYTFVDSTADPALTGPPSYPYMTNNLYPPGSSNIFNPKDINSGALHVSGDLTVAYNGQAAGSMWDDYRLFRKNGVASAPQTLWFRNANGFGLKLTFFPVKWDTFALDRNATRIKGTVAFKALADRAKLFSSPPVNSKLAATVYSPDSRLLIY
jgi:hypothetical protein